MLIKDRELQFALKLVLTAAAVLILGLVIWKLAPILTLMTVALLLVYCIAPLVNFLTVRKIKPLWAALITATLILFALVAFFYLLIPRLVLELRALTSFINVEFFNEMMTKIEQLQELDRRFNLQLAQYLSEQLILVIRQLPAHLQQILRNLTGFSMMLVSQLWIVLGLVFLVFYLVQDLEKAKTNLTRLFPQIYHQKVTHIISIVDQKVGAYIRGTLMKCFMVGFLTSLGLSIFGMPFSLMLGILAGLLNIVLYIGPIMAALPALLWSFLPGMPNFFLILGVYVFVQTLDAFVFTPVFLGKAVDLSPLTVVVVILIGSRLFGIFGILIAIPVAAILKVLLVHYYLERRRLT